MCYLATWCSAFQKYIDDNPIPITSNGSDDPTFSIEQIP